MERASTPPASDFCYEYLFNSPHYGACPGQNQKPRRNGQELGTPSLSQSLSQKRLDGGEIAGMRFGSKC